MGQGEFAVDGDLAERLERLPSRYLRRRIHEALERNGITTLAEAREWADDEFGAQDEAELTWHSIKELRSALEADE